MKDFSDKTCGECARFKKGLDSGCLYKQAISEGTIRANDQACEDFKPKPKEKKEKHKEKTSGLAEEGYFESIYHDNEPRFLVLKGNEFSIVENVSIIEKQFYPKERQKFPYDPYDYYPGQIPSREELFWKIRTEFHSFIDVESIWKEVLSSCVLLTYQQEKFLTVPYIYVYGDNESGKSTVLQLLKFLCYRPMYGVTVPSADIYGYLEDSEALGCILEDEIQGIDKDTDKIKVYKAGYKRGAVVPRTLLLQHDRIIKYYNTFCFKTCASEQIPQVKGFRERFIEIPMVEGYPEKEWCDVTEEDLKRLYDLRNMLLKWRMLSRKWQLPNPELSLKGRIKEIWKPILQITHDLSIYPTLANFVEEQKNERLSSKQNTLEGHIVKVVTELHNQAKENPVPYIPFQTIWFELASDLDGKIDDKKPHVMDTSEFFQVTKNKVGYRLREILSGKIKVLREKDSEGNWVSTKAYSFDSQKLRRIAKKYGYELVTKLPSLLSSESAQAPISTLKEHEGNVEKDVIVPLEVGKLSNSVTDSKPLTVQELLTLLRSSWQKGTVDAFIDLIVTKKDCSREEARELSEKWLDEGLVAFDPDGFLVWVP